MRRSQVSDGCQTLMMQTLESQLHRFDENLKSNPLEKLLEPNNLSRTAQRDLADLTEITVDHNMGICEDLEFQFETLMNTLTYEKDYLELKLQKVNRKLLSELTPQVEQKHKLHDMLEAMYEGQQLKQQQKELSLYSAKLKKDALEREAKISTSSLAKLEQECHIDALERLSLQSQELEQEVEKLREVFEKEYAEMPTDVVQARLKLQQLRDEVKYKEEVLKKKMAQA